MYILHSILLNSCYLGAMQPTICPLGYREKNNGNSSRVDFESTCETCPPGYYGARDDRSDCDSCRAGVVCMEGSVTDAPLGNDSATHGFDSTRLLLYFFDLIFPTFVSSSS